MNSTLPSLPPVSPFDPSPVVIGLLVAVVLLCCGVLIGYHIGKSHRRDTYRRIRQDLEEQVTAWKLAYNDAIERVSHLSPTIRR